MSNKIKNKQLIISSTFDINNQRLSNVNTPLFDNDAATKAYVDALKTITNEPTGFPAPNDTVNTTTIISISGNQFKILPKSSSFDYYIKGIKYTSTGNTLTITNVEGGHYFYFSGDTLLQATAFNSDFLKEYAYVSELYWDNINQVVIHIGDERHGMVMDWATHQYLHTTVGTRYLSGLGISLKAPVDSSGALDTHSEIQIENGQILDEDITHIIVNGSPQVLSPTAITNVYFLSGSTGIWRKSNSSAFPVKNIIDGGRLAYNQLSGATWIQTDVGQDNYVLSHIFATNDVYNPIIVVQGQATYTNSTLARTGANNELASLITNGLAFQEFVPLGTIIYQTSTSYNNATKSRIVSTDTGGDYIDWRFQKLSPSISPTSHSSLTNLSNDDHTQYLRTDGTRNVTGVMSYSTGNTFTNDNNLVDKRYVDTEINMIDFSYNNQNMLANTGISGIYLAVNTGITDITKSRVRVMLNSIELNVGNGTTSSECYFSNDAGATAKTWTNTIIGDYLYWNSTVAGYQLESNDEIDFIYLTRI